MFTHSIASVKRVWMRKVGSSWVPIGGTSGATISGGALARSAASRIFCLRTRPGSRIASPTSIAAIRIASQRE